MGKGAATVTGWKIWKKYIVRGNPIGFAYLLGFILILLGVIFVIFANYFLALILGVIFFLIACFFEWGTITAEGVLK
ncbi:MAG: hypothetical protein QXT86_11605 [Archaeoglobaceae archaeon]